MTNDSTKCCSSDHTCCSVNREKKHITIDFLYLDLSVCKRCQGAQNNLDLAIDEVVNVLDAAGYEIIVNKININTKQLAIKHEFLSSPTIRVNGNDIAMNVHESTCQDCGDLCGDSVDCRVWHYEGTDYNEPPKAMIINAILKEIYTEHKELQKPKIDYELPSNLETFFDGLEKQTKE
jgi:hypothetical protein